MNSTESIPEAIVRRAIAWRLRLDSAAHGERKTLISHIEAWCADDPRHRLAWQRIGNIRDDFDAMQQALPHKEAALPILRQASLDLQRRKALKLLLAAVTVGGSGAWLTRTRTKWGADFATATGERRRFTLEDGTRITLNTDSSLDVAYNDHQRLLILRGGEVMVESGPDSAMPRRRPLRLQCRFGLCEAIGTRFGVRERDDDSVLSVGQGRVLASQPGGERLIADAGQILTLSATGIHSLSRPHVDPGAWVHGMLSVNDIRLEAFVAELARYRHGHIACDPAVAGLRLSGVFQLQSPDLLLAHLERTLPVKVISRTSWWIRIIPRTA